VSSEAGSDRAVTALRRTNGGVPPAPLKSVAEAVRDGRSPLAEDLAEQPTRAKGGALGPLAAAGWLRVGVGPGSPVAMALRATRAGGLPEPGGKP